MSDFLDFVPFFGEAKIGGKGRKTAKKGAGIGENEGNIRYPMSNIRCFCVRLNVIARRNDEAIS
jgi:hypothetical protein